MDKLRSHITRVTVIVLLCAGFSLYMARPAQAKQSSQAFTRWFGTLAKSANGAELQQELNDLFKIDAQLDELITRASQIVSRHDDEFSFPFSESAAAQHVYQLLLIEWSQFQTGNEMAAVPAGPRVKLTSSFSFDTTGGFSAVVQGFSSSPTAFTAQNVTRVQQTNHTPSIVPMSSGIAICAP
ncbi:MAG TPA: hypothetical protein VFG39_07490 [Balneolaceae bacterium]|nr:hypothetical protein [Balneolaceae bacterium]